MSPEEARYAAVRKFGNVTRVKEETREAVELRLARAVSAGYSFVADAAQVSWVCGGGDSDFGH